MNNQIDFVLLIDDDDTDNELHKRVLSKSGCVNEVKCFSYADEALEFLRTSPKQPSLIFLDINMPRMNGFQFLEEYATLPEEKKAKCVVMMLSTSVNPNDFEQAKKTNPKMGFHSKPLRLETVIELVDEHFSAGDS